MTPQQQNNIDSSQRQNSFFNRNFWIKLSFIGVSALMWFLTKLSIAGYTENISYAIEVSTNQPELVITELSESFVTVRVEGSGYDLLAENTTEIKNIQLTLEDAEIIDDHTYAWDTRKNMDFITSQLPSDLEVISITPHTIVIHTDKLIKKMVDVDLQYETDLKTPYRLYGKLEVTPPQVEVWMPQESFEMIDKITTELFTINETEAEQNIKVQLLTLDSKMVVKPDFVNVKTQVRAYTQKKIEVPIQFKNLPVNGHVKLFPPNITVTINLSQEDYDKIDANSFVCVADFNRLIADKSRVPLSLEQWPDQIDLIDWGQKSVEFLIIEE